MGVRAGAGKWFAGQTFETIVWLAMVGGKTEFGAGADFDLLGLSRWPA
jgi:hypothetical protein